eukprot:170957-Chlamydomonas_euryale.AAC.8
MKVSVYGSSYRQIPLSGVSPGLQGAAWTAGCEAAHCVDATRQLHGSCVTRFCPPLHPASHCVIGRTPAGYNLCVYRAAVAWVPPQLPGTYVCTHTHCASAVRQGKCECASESEGRLLTT